MKYNVKVHSGKYKALNMKRIWKLQSEFAGAKILRLTGQDCLPLLTNSCAFKILYCKKGGHLFCYCFFFCFLLCRFRNRFIAATLCVKLSFGSFLLDFLKENRQWSLHPFLYIIFSKIRISSSKLLLLVLLLSCLLFIFFLKKESQFSFLSEFKLVTTKIDKFLNILQQAWTRPGIFLRLIKQSYSLIKN